MAARATGEAPADGYTQRDIQPEGAGRGFAADAASGSGRLPRRGSCSLRVAGCHARIASQVHAGPIGGTCQVHRAPYPGAAQADVATPWTPLSCGEPDQFALYPPVSSGGGVRRDADHELADRCCRGRPPRTPAAAVVHLRAEARWTRKPRPARTMVGGQVGDALPGAAVQFHQRARIERQHVAEEGR